MQRKLRSALVGAAVVGLAAATTAPALADHRLFRDTRGDAPATADLRKVKIWHTADEVRITIKVANLRRTNDAMANVAAWIDTTSKRSGPDYQLAVGGFEGTFLRVRDGRTKPWPDADDPYGDRRCPGFRYRYGASTDLVRLVVPRSCIGNPPRVRAAVTITADDGAVLDRTPDGSGLSRWVHRP